MMRQVNEVGIWNNFHPGTAEECKKAQEIKGRNEHFGNFHDIPLETCAFDRGFEVVIY